MIPVSCWRCAEGVGWLAETLQYRAELDADAEGAMGVTLPARRER